MLTWSATRRLFYLAIVVGFLLLVGLVIYLIFKPEASCFDGKQNQGEFGVDCGGPCAKVCDFMITPFRSLWVRPFSIVPETSSVIALVENNNLSLGVSRLFYTVTLLSENNTTITTKRGETYANQQEKFVIFEPNLNTNGQRSSRAYITFDQPIPWQQAEFQKPLLTVARRSFVNEPTPRLEALLTNESTVDLRNIQVPVILSDRNNNAFSGSVTVVDRLRPGESTLIYFTWPEPFTEEISLVDFYPRVSTFDLFR